MTRTRRRGGPWPGWLRWWHGQGGPARDAAIMDRWLTYLELGIMRPGQLVADDVGVSRSTVQRAVTRYQQRAAGDWPPQISNGFGLSAVERRRARLRQQGINPYTGQPVDPALERYRVPAVLQDDDDPDREGWGSWTG